MASETPPLPVNLAEGGRERPLVTKGTDRIEAIMLTTQDVRREATLYTYVFSRAMRRDFNVTSVKLFFFCKSRDGRRAVQELLKDLADEARSLTDLAHRFEMPDIPSFSTCTMRIVSDEADSMFQSLVLADRALHKILHSDLAEPAEENAIPFFRAYTHLRQCVFGFPRRPNARNR